MRLILILAAGLLLSPYAVAAKCKWAIDKEDHFKTKRVVASTMWKGMALHLGRHNDEFYVLGYMQSIGKKASFDQDTPMVFIFQDGTEVQVLPLEQSTGRRTALGLLLNNRKSETAYQASQDAIAALSQQRISAIELHYRVSDGLQVHKFPFGKANSKKLVRYSACLVEHTDN